MSKETSTQDKKMYLVTNGIDKGIIISAVDADQALRLGNREYYSPFPVKERFTIVQPYVKGESFLSNKKFENVVYHFSGEGSAGKTAAYDVSIDSEPSENQKEFIGNSKIDYITFYNGNQRFEGGGSLEKGAINYLGDLWFAVQESRVEDYPKLAEGLDRLNVSFKIQNEVSNDAQQMRGRKAISTEEAQQRIRKILTENGIIKYSDGGGVSAETEEQMPKPIIELFDNAHSFLRKKYPKLEGKEELEDTDLFWDMVEDVRNNFDTETPTIYGEVGEEIVRKYLNNNKELDGGGLSSENEAKFNYELKVQHDYPYKNIANRWLEDCSKDSLKYKLAILLLREKKNPDEILGIKNDSQYASLLRSLEKAKGESNHEMSWRTENYTLNEAEKWARESLREIFYVHGEQKTANGVGLSSEIEEKIAKLQKVVDSAMIPDAVKQKARLEIEKLKSEVKSEEVKYKSEGLSTEQREINKKALALVIKNTSNSKQVLQGMVHATLEDANYHTAAFEFAKLIDSDIKTKQDWYDTNIFIIGGKERQRAIEIAQMCGWEGEKIVATYEYVLKMLGFHYLADKLKEAMKDDSTEGNYPNAIEELTKNQTFYATTIAEKVGLRQDAVADFIARNGLNEKETLNIVQGVGMGKVSSADFMTAVIGNPNNEFEEKIVAFAKSDEAFKTEPKKEEIKFDNITLTVDTASTEDGKVLYGGHIDVFNHIIKSFTYNFSSKEDLVERMKNYIKEIKSVTYNGSKGREKQKFPYLVIFNDGQSEQKEVFETASEARQFYNTINRIVESNKSEIKVTETPIVKDERVAGRNISDISTYIPHRAIESIVVTHAGKKHTLKGSDIFDGIYVENKVLGVKDKTKKKPKVARTQFEDETYEFGNGGYTRPANDIKTTGKYEFRTKTGLVYEFSVVGFERAGDSTDSLYFDDGNKEAKKELGSVIINNNAWKRLSKGDTIIAISSTGIKGKLTRIGNLYAHGGSTESEVANINNRIYNLQQLKEVANSDEQSYYENQIKQLEKEKESLLKQGDKPKETKKRGWFFKDGGQTPTQKKKIEKVMHEFKMGTLKSSSGDKVTDREQAIAIALSEAGLSNKMADGGDLKGATYVSKRDIEKITINKGGKYNLTNDNIVDGIYVKNVPLKQMLKSKNAKIEKINIKGFQNWMPGIKYLYFDKENNTYYYDDFDGGYLPLRNTTTLENLELFLKNKKEKTGWSHKK